MDETIYVGQSGVCDGLGIFAKRKIRAGEVWNSGTDVRIHITYDQFIAIYHRYPKFFDFLLDYSYYQTHFNALILELNPTVYTNHSKKPNSGISLINPNNSIAITNIQPNEEILEDYTKYDRAFWFNIDKYVDFGNSRGYFNFDHIQPKSNVILKLSEKEKELFDYYTELDLPFVQDGDNWVLSLS